jgi:hypothetical protein
MARFRESENARPKVAAMPENDHLRLHLVKSVGHSVEVVPLEVPQPRRHPWTLRVVKSQVMTQLQTPKHARFVSGGALDSKAAGEDSNVVAAFSKDPGVVGTNDLAAADA